MRALIGTLILATSLCACTGTRTGNHSHDGFPVPEGAQLARSALAHDAAPAADRERDAELARGNRAFAWDLYRALNDGTENLFFSPFSISVAMAMTYAGAKADTERELASALHYTLPQPELHEAFNATSLDLGRRKDQLQRSADGPARGDGFELSIVNQAWGMQDYAFRAAYLDVLALNYGAGLLLVDFTETEPTRALINRWVEEQTKQRVRALLPEGSILPDTKLVLTNAIYFKASWLEPFDPDVTLPATFKAPGGDRSVQMMKLSDTKLPYGEGASYQVVKLKYLAPDVSMLLVLPAEGRFAEVAQGFDGAFFDAVRASIDREVTAIQLPRWMFESERKLKAPLRGMGVEDAFISGQADLSGMGGDPGRLFIDEIYHKAFIAVDEQGTEAAAATAVVIRDESAALPQEIVFDRPFIFVVFDEPTGQILFIGQLIDPGQ
jgi:serpin B